MATTESLLFIKKYKSLCFNVAAYQIKVFLIIWLLIFQSKIIFCSSKFNFLWPSPRCRSDESDLRIIQVTPLSIFLCFFMDKSSRGSSLWRGLTPSLALPLACLGTAPSVCCQHFICAWYSSVQEIILYVNVPPRMRWGHMFNFSPAAVDIRARHRKPCKRERDAVYSVKPKAWNIEKFCMAQSIGLLCFS